MAESHAQSTIWLEDFQGLADGTIVDNGSTAWSRDVSSCDFGDAGGGYFEVRSNQFQGLDTDGEAVWFSEWIDISTYSNCEASVDLAANGLFMGADDYIRAYYSVDGGVETIFTDGNQSGQFGTVTAESGTISGDSVQVIIRMNNSSVFFIFFWLPAINSFDNVTVSGNPTLDATVNSTGVTCLGGSDGTITITNPIGGSGFYEYTINGGLLWQGSGSFTGLSAATYDVRIRDSLFPASEVTLNSTLDLTEPNDVIPPVISGCPANINTTADTSYCGANVTWTEPTASDNCSGVVLSSTHNPGDNFPVGTTTVTYTATDASSNTDVCTFDVIVGVAAPPVITGSTEVCTPVQEAYSVMDPGSHTFQWTVTNGTIAGSNTNPTVTIDWAGTLQGTVDVTITSGSGCTNANNITVDKGVTPSTGIISSSSSLTRR